MTYANVLTALADPTRREVFEGLRSGPRSVTDLARGLPVSRAAVSQHLKVLEAANLVTADKRGRHRFYRIDVAGLAPLRAYVESYWTDVLDAFASSLQTRSRP